jgi:hypothetical protein
MPDLTGRSKKPEVIEWLFNQRWREADGSLSNPDVTLEDVKGAIRLSGVQLSDRNVANFIKDFIRNKRSANVNFPRSVFERGYTVSQVTGEDRCFRFIRIPEAATEPFPNVIVPSIEDLAAPHRIESVSLPIASRRLGRADEAWTTQVAVRLRLIETHFALYSDIAAVQIDPLQMSVKLRRAEADALYLALVGDKETGEVAREILVCVEVKGGRDDILEDQILSQIKSLALVPNITQPSIVAVAVKGIRDSGRSLLHVVEFQEVIKSEVQDMEVLSIASQRVYEFVPSVPGLGGGR